MIAISAGNIRRHYPAVDYLNQNDLAGIESPAQAWNALTVGAFTERCNISDATFAGWRVMAPAGDLSPCSRTSMTFNDDWPIKPEVVSEGGNLGVNPATGAGDHVDDLALLSTFHRPNERLLTVTGDTSAAAALVARMGAQLLAENSDAWPETVRALIVHSARWTNAMRAHLPQNPNQSHKKVLVRRYGYGVPDLERMLRSASNDVTLVVEGEMQPFRLDGHSGEIARHDPARFPLAEGRARSLGRKHGSDARHAKLLHRAQSGRARLGAEAQVRVAWPPLCGETGGGRDAGVPAAHQQSGP